MDYLNDNNPADFNYLVSVLSPDIPALSEKVADDQSENVHGYIYVHKKELPINSKKAATLSKIYFETYKNDRTRLNPVANNYIHNTLAKAASFFGLVDEFKLIEAVVDNLQIKRASCNTTDTKYALLYKKANTTYGVYRINTVSDVIDSARELANDKSKMTLDWFKKASIALVKRAEELGVTSNYIPRVVKEAGVEREIDNKLIKLALDSRLSHFKVDDESKEIYTELFRSVEANLNKSAEVDEYLTLIEDFDRLVGIDYKHGIIDPYAAVYSGITTQELNKLAAEHFFLNDVCVPVEAFTKLSEQAITNRFDNGSSSTLLELQKKASNPSIINLHQVSKQLETMESVIRNELAELILEHDQSR